MNTALKLRTKIRARSNPTMALVMVSDRSLPLVEKVTKLFPKAKVYCPKSVTFPGAENLLEDRASKTLEWLGSQEKLDVIVAFMATGIVVRSIAGCLRDKSSDPAVIVCDEAGHFTIPLLSGHVGGANEFANKIARALNNQAVITTATDSFGRLGLDTFAMDHQLLYQDFRAQTLTFNSVIASGSSLILEQEEGVPIPNPWQGPGPAKGKIVISARDKIPQGDLPQVQLIPQSYLLGTGCRKETPPDLYEDHFYHFLAQVGIHPLAIAKLVSIDLKAKETAILNLANKLAIPFETYSKEDLLPYEDLYPGSAFVKQTVGVGAVAQTSAHLASKGRVLSDRYAQEGITFCLAKIED